MGVVKSVRGVLEMIPSEQRTDDVKVALKFCSVMIARSPLV
jgi:hypothetical protein